MYPAPRTHASGGVHGSARQYLPYDGIYVVQAGPPVCGPAVRVSLKKDGGEVIKLRIEGYQKIPRAGMGMLKLAQALGPNRSRGAVRCMHAC